MKKEEFKKLPLNENLKNELCRHCFGLYHQGRRRKDCKKHYFSTKNIVLNSMFTPYTIDTYSTFTMDNEEDYVIESLSEESGRELTYDDIDWTYDHKGFVQLRKDANK